MKNTLYVISIAVTVLCAACKKKNVIPESTDTLKEKILSNTAHAVCLASYSDLSTAASQLHQSALAMQAHPSVQNLQICRTQWLAVRAIWEKTEAWLFGPITANNIDPRIDTWPVDFTAIDSVMAHHSNFTETFIDGLADALKGFHPVEYYLWGAGGQKTNADFTAQELEFLVALTFNLEKLCTEVHSTWLQGFANSFASAGKQGSDYPTQESAFIEIVDAMSGICDEVANGKISEPFIAQNPNLEESPFASNSINDFKNNIQGVMILYQASYAQDETGLDDLVKQYNTSLDLQIKQAHAAALQSLQAIQIPFGTAIIQQPILVQQAIDKINDLQQIIDQQLKPLLIQHT